jgi:radical SAM superfamily enzyme YgiQ (UPF0313 family)
MKDKKSGCRVMFITPPRGLWKDKVQRPWISTQPLGVAYIAASLRQAGFSVKIIDGYSFGISGDEIRQRLDAFRPQVVGISALTPQWPDAERVADIVKSVNDEILTVVGGPHVTALPAETAAHPHVDVAVTDEGELTMVDICDAVAIGDDLREVAGIVLGINGTVSSTAPQPWNTELDKLPFPAHELLPPPAFYNPFPSWGKKGNFSCIISGRGCPYGCCFCDVTAQQGKRYRLRSAKNVVDEITWLNQSFKVSMFSFRDPSMICSRPRLLEICELISKRGLDIAWTCNSRANEVDPEMLAAMKKAGCRRMQYGIEVGNAQMLEKIKKTTRERVMQAVRDTRRAGIMAHGYFLFGFVDETPETIQETIEFAKELDLDSASFAVMVPFPGTAEFKRYRDEGLLLTMDWRAYDIMGRPVYRHKNLNSEELFKATRRAYRQFYLRPRIVGRQLKKNDIALGISRVPACSQAGVSLIKYLAHQFAQVGRVCRRLWPPWFYGSPYMILSGGCKGCAPGGGGRPGPGGGLEKGGGGGGGRK